MSHGGKQINTTYPSFRPNVNKRCSAQADNQLRMAAYEVLNAFVTNAAPASLHIVAKLSDYILERLEETVPMQQQIVSVEDRITLEEMQTSLTSVLLVRILKYFYLKLLLRPTRRSCNAWKAKSNLRPTA